MTSAVRADPPRRTSRSRVWSAVRLGAVVALAAVAANLVAGRRTELEGAATVLRGLRWGWLVLAFSIELTSVVAFAEVERRMLVAGGLRVGLWPLTGIALAGNSLQNSLPGGVAWASVFAYRQFRVRGADDVLAAWTMVAVEILSGASLAILAGVGVALAGYRARSRWHDRRRGRGCRRGGGGGAPPRRSRAHQRGYLGPAGDSTSGSPPSG